MRPAGGAAAWGLLGAWMVHDLEEAATMPGWTVCAQPRLRERLSFVPAAALRAAGMLRRSSRPSVRLALSFVGVVGGARLTARLLARRLGR